MTGFKVNQTSMRSPNAEQGWGELLDDVAALVRANNARASTIWLSGPRLIVPVTGTAAVSLVTAVATASSTGSNNHTIGVYRNGQPLAAPLPIVTWNGATACEWPAYSIRPVGSGRVSAGDEIRPYITVAGTPSPTLTVDNITLLLRLTPQGA
jgi:hypothetical protein